MVFLGNSFIHYMKRIKNAIIILSDSKDYIV